MSKVEVPVKEFSASLKFLRRFAGKGASLARFGEAGTVSVQGEASGARCAAPPGLGVFAVPFDHLLAVVAAAESQRGQESITLGLTDSNFTWSAGAARGRIALVNDGSAPDFPRADGPRVVVGDVFYRALDRAVAVCPRDDRLPMLRGVQWTLDGVVVASDGYRAVMCTSGKPGLDVVLPDHLVRAAAGYGFTSASVGERSAHFYSEGDSEAYGVLYASEFPAAKLADVFVTFARRIAAGELVRFDVDHDSQPSAPILVKRVADTAEFPGRRVRVCVGNNAVEVHCENEAGEIRVHLDAAVEGGPAEFCVNGEYLAEVVGYCCPVWVSENALYAANPSGSFQAAVVLTRG